MANDTGIYSVKHLLNRVLNSTSDRLKVEFSEITIAAGSTFPIKDSNGFTVFYVDEDGNVYHKGALIKI